MYAMQIYIYVMSVYIVRHVSVNFYHASVHFCHVSIPTFLSFMSFPYRLVNEVLAPGTLGPGRRYVLFPGENPLPSP